MSHLTEAVLEALVSWVFPGWASSLRPRSWSQAGAFLGGGQTEPSHQPSCCLRGGGLAPHFEARSS